VNEAETGDADNRAKRIDETINKKSLEVGISKQQREE